MLSDISVNSNTLINPQQQSQQQAYQLIKIQSCQFRVLSRQFKNKSSMISFWCVFWLTSTLLSTTLLITTLQDFNSTILLYSLFVCTIILLALSLYLRKQLQKIIVFSLVDFTFFLIAIIVLEALPIKCFTIATGIFILNQIVLSIFLIKQKGKMFLEVLILAELAFVTAKGDELVNISWAQSLIPLIPFFAFIACAFIFVLTYTLLLYCCYQQNFKNKRTSLIFLLSSLACFTVILSIPLCWGFFHLDLTILSILSMGLSSTNSLYLWIYNKEIAFHFCVHKQQVLQNDKDRKIEVINIPCSNKKALYRYSSNWFGHQLKDSLFPSQNKYPECLVCTQRQSDIVWLPCGHLVLCQGCCKDVIQNKMIHCMLCKQKPTNISQVKKKDQAQIKLQRQMGLINQSTNRQELVIAHYEIKIY